ncbi:MAG: glycosyltransferase [Candidatus Moraniibacteriota bacterium]|nr:MAG: glycosyltransferase [Candidatus Moranbacteria bacterium]
MKNKTFSLIVVNYASASLLERCIFSLSTRLEKEGFLFEWIIINNDFSESILIDENKKKKYSLQIFLHPRGNVGFGGACNFAAKKAKGEYLWFINPDTEYLSGDIKESFNFFLSQKVEIMGFRLVEKKGTIQPWIYGDFLNFFWWIFRYSIFVSGFVADPQKPLLTGWVTGATLFVRKKTFFDLGGFDENFFLYFEDMDFCLRTKEIKGKNCWYYPQITFCHQGGKSFQENKKLQKTAYYDSMERYSKKHLSFLEKKFFSLYVYLRRSRL